LTPSVPAKFLTNKSVPAPEFLTNELMIRQCWFETNTNHKYILVYTNLQYKSIMYVHIGMYVQLQSFSTLKVSRLSHLHALSYCL
jgi:hypothetical protein